MASFKKKYELIIGRCLTHKEFSLVHRQVKRIIKSGLDTGVFDELRPRTQIIRKIIPQIVKVKDKKLHYYAGILNCIGGFNYSHGKKDRPYKYLMFKVAFINDGSKEYISKTIDYFSKKFGIYFCKSYLKTGKVDVRTTCFEDLVKLMTIMKRYCNRTDYVDKEFKVKKG